jgi:hypothetical protein
MSAMKYLLPCPGCGAKTSIEPRQAGQQVFCGCGAALDIPRLGEMRQLEIDPVRGVSKPPVSTWNPIRGFLFVGGIVLAMIGLAIAGMSVANRMRLPKPPVVQFDAERIAEEVDSWTPADSFDVWKGLREQGLGPYMTPAHVMAQQIADRLQRFIAIGGAVAVLGLLVTAASVFVRHRR